MFNPFMSGPPLEEISCEEVKGKIENKDDFVLLDVRTHMEYESVGHLKNSRLLPLQSLWNHVDELDDIKEKEIVVYCRSGQRSAEACRVLNSKGFKTKNMVGGIIRWQDLKYETA